MNNQTYTASDVAEILNLPYGRNKLYSELRKYGFLDNQNHPSKWMQKKGFIIVRRPPIFIGVVAIVPIFNWDFIDFFERFLALSEEEKLKIVQFNKSMEEAELKNEME